MQLAQLIFVLFAQMASIVAPRLVYTGQNTYWGRSGSGPVSSHEAVSKPSLHSHQHLLNSAGVPKLHLQVLPLPGIDLGLPGVDILPFHTKTNHTHLKEKGFTWGLLAGGPKDDEMEDEWCYDYRLEWKIDVISKCLNQ